MTNLQAKSTFSARAACAGSYQANSNSGVGLRCANPTYAAAINGAATHLVSFNLRDFDPPVQRHALSAPARLGPVACCPADFLKLVEKPS